MVCLLGDLSSQNVVGETFLRRQKDSKKVEKAQITLFSKACVLEPLQGYLSVVYALSPGDVTEYRS